MAVSQVTHDFLVRLKKSRLLSDDDLKDAAITVFHLDEPTPEQIADILVEDGFLTHFQAERLLEGDVRGLVFDGYKLLEVLGVGGMGWVYIAEEVETKWRVALKVLPDACRRDAGTLARFQLEAQAGMRLDHPNVVRSLALRRTEDIYGPIHYVVMELVRGINLFELLLLKRKLDYRQACDIIMQVAEGLDGAHRAGLIHRDVKPENLLICADGTVKILDFGLAMVDENDEEFSMAMIFGQNRLGTADYISPEQYIDSYKIDPRADIYSLGCTFYFALSGKVPFPFKTTAKKLKAHLKKKPTPIRELRPDIPKRVAAIVHKMMAKRPENRIQTAADVVRYLTPLAERQETVFNFRSVLASRLSHAKKRIAQKKEKPALAEDKQTQTPQKKDSTSSDSVRQSTIETIVREDTRLDQSKRRDTPRDER
ncbi:MAG: serine/threonine-protein kinase [Pirellulaceae bacterium]